MNKDNSLSMIDQSPLRLDTHIGQEDLIYEAYSTFQGLKNMPGSYELGHSYHSIEVLEYRDD